MSTFGGFETTSTQGLGAEIDRSRDTIRGIAEAIDELAKQGDAQQVVPHAATDPIRVVAAGLRALEEEVLAAVATYHRDHAEDERRDKHPTKGDDVQERADVHYNLKDS